LVGPLEVNEDAIEQVQRRLIGRRKEGGYYPLKKSGMSILLSPGHALGAYVSPIVT
jgi:hypothetical protein